MDGNEFDKKIGVALLSFAHVHARGYADQVRDNPDLQAVVIWDEDEERGRNEADKRGLPFNSDLDAVLPLPDVQAVVCSAPTNRHRDILISSAQAGKHIFTEKVADHHDCRRDGRHAGCGRQRREVYDLPALPYPPGDSVRKEGAG